MTKGSLIEYQALKIATLEQRIERMRLAISSQLWGNSGSCVAMLRVVAGEECITKEEAVGYTLDQFRRPPELARIA